MANIGDLSVEIKTKFDIDELTANMAVKIIEYYLNTHEYYILTQYKGGDGTLRLEIEEEGMV